MSGLANYDGAPFRGVPFLESDQDDEDIRFYNNTGATLTNGLVKIVSTMVDITDASNPILSPILVACSTMATGVQIAVVNDPAGSVADKTWGTARIRGCVKASVNGDTVDVAYGDQLQVVNATPADFVVKTAATAGVASIWTGNTAAIALEANTGVAALHWVYLLGFRAVIAATA